MSMMSPPGRARSEKVGETVARFATYEAAQKAVSALIAGEVSARHIAIVGIGLRSIERVTGRLGYATAARSGAVNGALLGLFFSAIMVLGAPTVPVQAFVGVILVGIAIGMLLSLLTYTVVRRRRDYASVMHVVADHYDVAVDNVSLAKARQVLGHGPGVAAAPGSAPSAPPAAPPSGGAATPEDTPTSRPESPAAAPASDARPRYGELTPQADAVPPRYGERVTTPDEPATLDKRAAPDADTEAPVPHHPDGSADADQDANRGADSDTAR